MPKGERGDVLSGAFTVTSISFRETRAGGAFEWHDAPVRQFVLTLSGTLDFQTRAGTHFILRPGDILLAEDTISTGCGLRGSSISRCSGPIWKRRCRARTGPWAAGRPDRSDPRP